jgi:excisionase family DNA binding protein
MRAPEMRILTLKEAAELFNCHPSTLYRLAKVGAIPAFRLGGSWRFSQSLLIAWMQNQMKAVDKTAKVRSHRRQTPTRPGSPRLTS